MDGISHLSTAAARPGIRPKAKVMAAVNTVSTNNGNLSTFTKNC